MLAPHRHDGCRTSLRLPPRSRSSRRDEETRSSERAPLETSTLSQPPTTRRRRVCGTTSSNDDNRGQRTLTAMFLVVLPGAANRAQPHDESRRQCWRTVTPEVAERSQTVVDLATSLRFDSSRERRYRITSSGPYGSRPAPRWPMCRTAVGAFAASDPMLMRASCHGSRMRP
jgi:hypothetical protein